MGDDLWYMSTYIRNIHIHTIYAWSLGLGFLYLVLLTSVLVILAVSSARRVGEAVDGRGLHV